MFNLLTSLGGPIAFVLLLFLSMHTWSRLYPLGFIDDDNQEGLTFFFRIGLGAIILSSVLFLLACLQQLTLLHLKILMSLSVLALFVGILFSFIRKNISFPKWSGDIAVLLGFYLLGMLILVLIPADEKDDLIYHLEIPRQMLAQQGWAWLPDNIYSFFPHFMELYFAVGLAVSGEIAARLINSAFGLLLLATLYQYACQRFDRTKAIISVTICMFIPTVFLLMATAYVDLAFTWFVLLAWIASEKIDPSKKGLKWAALTGLFCGATACIKYTGIQTTLVLCAVVLIRALTQKRGRAILPYIVILLGAMTLVFLPYVIRNTIFTGWPLYPFHFFGLGIKKGLNWDAERAALYFEWIKTFGVPIHANNVLGSLLSPIRVFMDGEFNNPEKFDGVIGPLFLCLPFFYLCRKMNTASKGAACFCVLYMGYWVLTTQQARFLLPMLPLASILLAVGICHLKRPLALAILVLGLLFNLGTIPKELVHKKPFRYLSGQESREMYLAHQHRVYAMYAAANRLLPSGAKVYLLQMKNYGYYLRVNWTADFIFERNRLERLLKTNPSEGQIIVFFKIQNVTHLLVDHKALRSPQTGLEPEVLKPLDQFLSSRAKILAMKDDMVLYELQLLIPPPSAV